MGSYSSTILQPQQKSENVKMERVDTQTLVDMEQFIENTIEEKIKDKINKQIPQISTAQPLRDEYMEQFIEQTVQEKINKLTTHDQIIRQLVKNIIENPQSNIKFIPDSIEEKVYLCVLNQLSESLKEILKTSKIQILGYNITFNVEEIKSP